MHKSIKNNFMVYKYIAIISLDEISLSFILNTTVTKTLLVSYTYMGERKGVENV